MLKYGFQNSHTGTVEEHSYKKGRTLVLSDVDGTLVKSSLVLSHACFLHDETIINLEDLPSLWKADMKNETLISALAEAYRESIAGKTLGSICAKDFMQNFLSDYRNFYDALHIVNSIKSRAKADVILVSGSPSYLVDELAQKYGFQGVGSHYVRNERGQFTGECKGMFSQDAKRSYLNSLDFSPYDDVYAFGDTKSDVSLFERSNYSVLVEPSDETREAISHKVHEIIY